MNEMKSWADLANRYSMVLFNQVTSIEDGAVLMEWSENHECDSKEAQYHMDTCETKDCKKCEEYKEEYGEMPECSCEAYQWFAIAVSELDAEHLNKKYDLDIFYSETLDLYILPVYHFGTSWSILGLKGGYVNTGLGDA